MPSYTMVGEGGFGGSNNFLAQLGGIGQDWGDGMMAGMRMGTALMNYNNAVAQNPSALQAKIAQNVANQGTYEGEHYRNAIMNPRLSRLASGADLQDWERAMLQTNGYGDYGMVNGTPSATNTAQGTPQVTQTAATPATTPATALANPAPITVPYANATAQSNGGFTGLYNRLTGKGY